MSSGTIIRKDLLTASMEARILTDVSIKEISFEPGQKGGLHLHPCPVTGYIVKGTAMLQVEGEAEQVLPAGHAFYEPALARIAHFDNYSDTEPMTFVAFYLLNGDQSLIEMIHED